MFGWLLHVAWRPNALVLITMAATTAGIAAGLTLFHLPISLGLYTGTLAWIGPIALVLSLWAACLISLALNRPDRPTAFLISRLTNHWRIGWRLLRGVPVFLALPAMFSAFTSYKSQLFKIVPYYADPYALDLDRLLHGIDPWRLLQPIVGHPWITVGLNQVYILWFGEMFLTLSIGIFIVDQERLRSQFLTAYFFSWGIAGCIAATLLASVGPCFYSAFFHADPYADLFSYLDKTRQIYFVPERDLQAALFDGLRKGGIGVGEGISAMPSMHVGIAVLNAIFLSRLNRYVGWAAWLFAALIFIGSVALGWHYAVDGYVAALLVWLIWIASGKLATRFHPA
jgi:hypothetical protein